MSAPHANDLTGWPQDFVTIVFTDIEGSTKMTNRLNRITPLTYEEKLRDPHRVELEKFIGDKGREVQRAGDGHMWVFQNPDEAIACMVGFQQSLMANPIRHTEGEEEFVVSVRIGMHHTENRVTPTFDKGWVEYPGPDTNFAARLATIANGGQVLISQHALESASHEANKHNPQAWHNRHLKDFADDPRRSEPVTVHELLYDGGPPSREPGVRFFTTFYEIERNRYVPRPAKEAEVIRCFEGTGESKRKERLVQLVASGGMGKTRLAVNAASQMAWDFAQGVYFISLTFVTARTAEAVSEAIARQMGLGEEAFSPGALVKFLTPRKVLLVLDNYESVASEEVGPFLALLTTETLGVSLIVTTRQNIQVTDMQWPVSLDEGMTLPEAKELFFDRARRSKAGFAPGAAENGCIDLILVLLAVNPDIQPIGVIPLAVELVAAWVGRRELAEIERGLREQPLKKFTALPAGATRADSKPTKGRHDSLTNSLQWSYGLLFTLPHGARLQRTFEVCSLFADVSIEAMQPVMGNDDVEDDLETLETTSLLRRAPRQNRTFYRLHRFTRDFAAAKREALPDAPALAERFLAFYSQKVQEHKSVNKQEDQIHRDWLDAEINNLFAAADCAHQSKELVLLFQFLRGLFGYFQIRSLWNEWETMAKQLLEVARDAKERGYEAVALGNLGIVYRLQGKWSEAETAYNQDLAICREFGDRRGEGQTLNNLGIVYQSQGKWREAETVYNQSLTIYREFGDRLGEGTTLGNLGGVYQLQSKWSEAETVYNQSLTIKREFGDRLGEGHTLGNLGGVYQLQSKWSEAETAFNQSLTIKREFGDRRGEGLTLENLALLWKGQDDFQKALFYARQAVEVLETTQGQRELEKARETLARVVEKLSEGSRGK